MTTLNTIIEEEKKNARENLMDIDEYQAESLDSIIASAMQRAYEAGREEGYAVGYAQCEADNNLFSYLDTTTTH